MLRPIFTCLAIWRLETLSFASGGEATDWREGDLAAYSFANFDVVEG